MHFGYICIEDSMAMKLFSPPPPLQQQGPRFESGSYIEPSFLGRVSSICVGSVMDSGFLTKSTYLAIIVGRNVSMNDYLSLC